MWRGMNLSLYAGMEYGNEAGCMCACSMCDVDSDLHSLQLHIEGALLRAECLQRGLLLNEALCQLMESGL